MKNKTVITIIASSLSTALYANNFNVVISKEQNFFETGKIETIVGEWLNVGTPSCVNDIEEYEIYFNVSFNQKETCAQNQEQTITTKKILSDGSEVIIDVNKKTKTEKTESTTVQIGSHLESTCKDIKSFEATLSDGEYTILQSGNPTVYCDMTRNGGGWMRVVSYNWHIDSDLKPSNLQKTVNKNILYSGYNYPVADGWWVSPWGAQNPNTVRWVEVNAQPLYAWTETMIDFEGLGFKSLDEFYNVHNTGISDQNSVNGQYLDGYSFTYGNQGSRGHLYSIASGYLTPPDDGNRLANELSWIGSDYEYQDSENTLSNYTYNLDTTFLGKTKTLGNEKISLRLMADQLEGDETIGIRKYILWVK